MEEECDKSDLKILHDIIKSLERELSIAMIDIKRLIVAKPEIKQLKSNVESLEREIVAKSAEIERLKERITNQSLEIKKLDGEVQHQMNKKHFELKSKIISMINEL